MKLLLQDVELLDEDNFTFDIYFDFSTNRFHASENAVPNIFTREIVYELTNTEENIIKNHRSEILDYCLGFFTDNDTVGLGDIFIHGKYIKRI